MCSDYIWELPELSFPSLDNRYDKFVLKSNCCTYKADLGTSTLILLLLCYARCLSAHIILFWPGIWFWSERGSVATQLISVSETSVRVWLESEIGPPLSLPTSFQTLYTLCLKERLCEVVEWSLPSLCFALWCIFCACKSPLCITGPSPFLLLPLPPSPFQLGRFFSNFTEFRACPPWLESFRAPVSVFKTRL